MTVNIVSLYDYMCCCTLVVFKVHNKYYWTNQDDCCLNSDFDPENKINTLTKEDAIAIALEILSDIDESELSELDSFNSLEEAEIDAGATNDPKLYINVDVEL